MSKDRYDVYDENIATSKRSRRKKQSKRGKKHSKGKKKLSLTARFFIVVASMLSVYCLGAFGYFAFNYYLNEYGEDVNGDGTIDRPSPITAILAPKLKERTTFVIMGLDEEGTRTDTIMVGCYNDKLSELSIMSVPRDTLIEVDTQTFNKMWEEFPEPGQRGMKINTVHHYGAEKYGVSLLKQELEKIIGTPIDYYVKVNFEAFRYLVDEMGGVEYNVPRQMDYDDPDQDLAIHLKPGLQTLKGSDAEGLVRYRKDNNGGGYNNADLGRIEVQQDFVRELLKQLISKDNLFKNADAYVKTLFKYVDTDIRISDAVKYMSVLKRFNGDNIHTLTIPSYIGSLYGFEGGVIINETENDKVCYDIFQKPSSEILAERKAASGGTGDQSNIYNDKVLKIQVLNGGYVNGQASETQNSLLSTGYNVTSVGTYQGEKANNTRIFVKEEGMGDEIVREFIGGEVIVDPNIANNFDIVVVLGIGE